MAKKEGAAPFDATPLPPLARLPQRLSAASREPLYVGHQKVTVEASTSCSCTRALILVLMPRER